MPAIARHGDGVMSIDGQGDGCASPMKTSVGQVNDVRVYANGILIVVEGNAVEPHNKSGCSIDGSVLTTFSNKVHIGGKGAGRIGDMYNSESENIIIQGSSNIMCG